VASPYNHIPDMPACVHKKKIACMWLWFYYYQKMMGNIGPASKLIWNDYY
jgi:hypothetical protein